MKNKHFFEYRTNEQKTMLKSEKKTNLMYSLPKLKNKILLILPMLPMLFSDFHHLASPLRGTQCPEFLKIKLIAFLDNFTRNVCVPKLWIIES